MLPLLTAPDIRKADAYTVAHEPIASIDLMERASKAFVGWFINHFPDKGRSIYLYCGTGNNGGDGLAIARLLHQHQYQRIYIYIARYSEKSTPDFEVNLKRLRELNLKTTDLKPKAELPAHHKNDIIIDALLGSGLNKPLAGDYARLAYHLNAQNLTVVAVDVPTGLFTEGVIPNDAVALKAEMVITFQQPKLNFLLPESGPFIDNWQCVNIGLDEAYIQSLKSPYQFIQEQDIRAALQPRKRFSNKGTFGHALIIAGSPETMGAALISSSACANAGAGLTTAFVPESGLTALNSYLPEVMAVINDGKKPDLAWDKFNVIAIGPGLGKEKRALDILKSVLKGYKQPMVIDADALNLLAKHQTLLKHIPVDSIITPHMKEFDRLFGEHQTWWERLQTAIKKAQELKLYIILKNNYTVIATPAGQAFFNSTGNAAMATGGMGDALTGIIAALLAQRYTPEQACIIGTYIHGKAGDELARPGRMAVVLPHKVIAQVPVTLARLMA